MELWCSWERHTPYSGVRLNPAGCSGWTRGFNLTVLRHRLPGALLRASLSDYTGSRRRNQLNRGLTCLQRYRLASARRFSIVNNRAVTAKVQLINFCPDRCLFVLNLKQVLILSLLPSLTLPSDHDHAKMVVNYWLFLSNTCMEFPICDVLCIVWSSYWFYCEMHQCL